MSKIFVSYRRLDSRDITERIYDRLAEYFGQDLLFKDVDDIAIGSDFRHSIEAELKETSVLLAVIGPMWLTCVDVNGIRCLDSHSDYVRFEIETAIKCEIPMVPVLVGNAAYPKLRELPECMQALVYFNGVMVRPDPDFADDMERLASAIEQWIPRPQSRKRKTVAHALSNVAREQEAERLDREWSQDREKLLVEIRHGNLGEGGYREKVIPTKTTFSGRVGAMCFAGFVTTGVGIGLMSLFGPVSLALPLIVSYLVYKSFDETDKAAEAYKQAEENYRQRRSEILGQKSGSAICAEADPARIHGINE